MTAWGGANRKNWRGTLANDLGYGLGYYTGSYSATAAEGSIRWWRSDRISTSSYDPNGTYETAKANATGPL